MSNDVVEKVLYSTWKSKKSSKKFLVHGYGTILSSKEIGVILTNVDTRKHVIVTIEELHKNFERYVK